MYANIMLPGLTASGCRLKRVVVRFVVLGCPWRWSRRPCEERTRVSCRAGPSPLFGPGVRLQRRVYVALGKLGENLGELL
jgi:hypothetical protein